MGNTLLWAVGPTELMILGLLCLVPILVIILIVKNAKRKAIIKEKEKQEKQKIELEKEKIRSNPTQSSGGAVLSDEQIKKLKELGEFKEKGILTEDEFNEQKKKAPALPCTPMLRRWN